MTKSILILGASGRIGRHAQHAFQAAGWQVRVFDRKAGVPLSQAARGMDIIFNGWNPPYPDWVKTVPTLTTQIIAAAEESGAAVMIPGNVYVFGPDMPAVLTPDTPHRAQGTLGQVRMEMEARYKASNAQTILLRAGDFIDTEASGNWFDQVITAGLAKGKFTYPGPLDRPHAWAFLPDLAAGFVALAERMETLPAHTDVAFPGFTLTGQDLASAVESATGASLKVGQMSWLPMQLGRPFWPVGRCLLEMRYLWDRPHSLDGSALHALIGPCPSTQVTEAIREALKR